jgi:hypothetical protein
MAAISLVRISYGCDFFLSFPFGGRHIEFWVPFSLIRIRCIWGVFVENVGTEGREKK